MSKLSDLLKKAKEQAGMIPPAPIPSNPIQETIEKMGGNQGIDRYGKSIQYNAEQSAFIDLVLSGKSCVLIGAAGTGKTTSTNGAISSLLQSKYFPPLESNHKHLANGNPGIVAVSYTRRAVMNLKRAMPSSLSTNCITIHKLLEYQPVFYEVFDPVTSEYKKTMKFEPNRNQYNKLPESIKTIIFDESSMVSVDLFHKVWIALEDPSKVQFIFLGDIQQLPPVFGSAILGFKLLKLPVIELIQVYRQALESPIIRLAHRILSGKEIPLAEFPDWNIPNKLKLHPWKKRISADSALLTIAAFFKASFDSKQYDPESDMILIPFNKACGTLELNKHIANHIARKSSLLTYEVIAGFNKHYFSEGEKVLYEKEDASIISIKRNPTYSGKWPQPAATNLDYWGTLQVGEGESEHHLNELESESESETDIDAMLEALANSEDDEGRVREASHILEVEITGTGERVEVKTASDINNLLLSYALTVHKSQGSEWKKVFLILHSSHNTMLQRELLYTACTRAREELYCICEPDSFMKGIQGQRIKGNTLEEKASFFQGKLDRSEETLLSVIS